MTHSEVEQLKRNYEEFHKLSPERRKELIDLHDEVQQDTKNGGHLQKLLTGYNLWLTCFDQQVIDGETDPVKRAQLVKIRRRAAKAAIAGGRRPAPAASRGADAEGSRRDAQGG